MVEYKAPYGGTVYDVGVKIGDVVKKGDNLCRVEAMKAITSIDSIAEGIVKEVRVKNEAPVDRDQVLIVVGD